MRGRRFGAAAATALVLLTGALFIRAPVAVTSSADSFEVRRIATADRPTFATAAPGDKRSLFVTDRLGRVLVFRGDRPPREFLDISTRVSEGNENGLLSIAFAPDYERSGKFYVYYTNREGNVEIDGFRRARSGFRARRGSRVKVIEIPRPADDATGHYGGTAMFGPDRKLYLAVGDGQGDGADPEENAQRLSSLRGKLLRIEPRAAGGYRVPDDNPFKGGEGRDEIYALGLRNPFRFSFDPATKTIAIGDVGLSTAEEIDYLTIEAARGANFGWDAFEGDQRIDHPDDDEWPLDDGSHDPPMHTLRHGDGVCAVTGGLTVRDPALPALRGMYLYADFCEGRLRAFRPSVSDNSALDDRLLGPRVRSPSAFGVDARGRVLVVSLRGGIYRLVAR